VGPIPEAVLSTRKVLLTFDGVKSRIEKRMNWFLLGVVVGLVVAPGAVVLGLLMMAWFENWQWKREQRKKVAPEHNPVMITAAYECTVKSSGKVYGFTEQDLPAVLLLLERLYGIPEEAQRGVLAEGLKLEGREFVLAKVRGIIYLTT